MFSYSTMMNNNLMLTKCWQHSLVTGVASVYSLEGVVKYMILMLLQIWRMHKLLAKKNLSFYLSFLKFQSSILQDNSFTDFLEIASNTLYSKKSTKLFLFSFKRKYIVPCPSLPNVLYLPQLSTPLVNNSFKQNQVFSWSPKQQTWTLDFLKTSSLTIAHDTG